MSARCGERNSSLTRTRASAGGRAAGVPPALPQWTMSPESLWGRALECRRRRSGWSVTSSSRLVFSSSSLCCRAIRFFTEYRRGSHARSDGAAAFGDRKISLVRKVCENDDNFREKFLFFAKIGTDRPDFLENWVAAGSASDSPLLERSFCSWFKLEHGDCPLSASIARPRR